MDDPRQSRWFIGRAPDWPKGLCAEWYGRFFSSDLDETYLWTAIRYVERNPVRARIVRNAENYSWSSAQAHCGPRQDSALTTKSCWRRQIEGIGDWSAWLTPGDEPGELEIVRRNADKGLPCGSEKFTGKLERLTGRELQYRPRGRSRKDEDKGQRPLYPR